jgi:uncharacterized delta-60 repeat protein
LLTASAGDLDETYNGTGINEDALAGFSASAIAFQDVSGGRVLAAGINFDGNPIVVRYHLNGDLDEDFGDDGAYIDSNLVSINTPGFPVAMKLDDDGNIMLAFTVDGGATLDDTSIVRLNPDGTFGGVSATTNVAGSQVVKNLGFDSDGNTYVVGAVFDELSAYVQRYVTGTTSVTFGTSGYLELDLGGSGAGAGDSINAVVGQPDGKLVIGGTFAATASMARLNSDGTFDLGFASGTGGILSFTDVITTIPATAMVDGSIEELVMDGTDIIGGGTLTYPEHVPSLLTAHSTIAAFRADGSGNADADFGEGGVRGIDGVAEIEYLAGVGSVFGEHMAVDSAGRIVVAGGEISVNGSQFAVGRFEPDGDVDSTFGTGGLVLTPTAGLTSTDLANGVAVQDDDKILVAGISTAPAFTTLRYWGDDESVGGAPPVADAGLDDSAPENSTVMLDASGSISNGTGTTYEWDFDGDTFYDDASGQTVLFTQDLPGLYTVGLRVTDSNGSSTDTVVITFTDVTPFADAGPDRIAVRQHSIDFLGSGNNPSGDVITAFDWDLDNNGSFETSGQNAAAVFTSTGTFTVRLRVTDDDGQTDIDTFDVTVSAAAVVGGDLLIGGGSNDVIAVRTTTTPGQYKVLFGGVEVGRFSPSGAVIVNAGDGDDSVDIGNGVVNVSVFGGEGNDTLDGGDAGDYLDGGDDDDVINGHGGNDTSVGGEGHDSISNNGGDDRLEGGIGNDTLVCGGGADLALGGDDNDLITGGTGDDTLHGQSGNDTINGSGGADVIYGGAGADDLHGQGGTDIVVGGDDGDIVQGGSERDLLIGGDGSDNIIGNADEDILIAGTTAHDTIEGNLKDILSIWDGPGLYAARVAALSAPLIGLLRDGQVSDDGDVDTLTGGAGTDWFLFNNDSSGIDVIVDLKPAETSTDVD